MEFYTINRIKTISRKLNSQTSGIVAIYSNTGNPGNINLATSTLISINSFVKNLKAHAKIESLAPIKMPNFQLEDSETDKLYKVLDVEWASPRKQLNLYISENSFSWNLIGAISLLNPSGYPYRIYNLMDLYTDNLAIELGENGRIGVEVVNVGYGLLTGNDAVTIHGSYVEEIVVQEKEKIDSSIINSCNSYKLNVNTESRVVFPANEYRRYVCIVNTTDYPVFLNLGSTAIANQGIPLIGRGSSYEINPVNGMYKGVISAISLSAEAAISGVACI